MKDIWKEQDIDDEGRERKKADRKARDKEASYQERLRKWEAREATQVLHHTFLAVAVRLFSSRFPIVAPRQIVGSLT